MMGMQVIAHGGQVVMTTLVLMVEVEETNAKEVGMILLMILLTPMIVAMTTMLVVMGIGGAEVEAGIGVAVVQAGIPRPA